MNRKRFIFTLAIANIAILGLLLSLVNSHPTPEANTLPTAAVLPTLISQPEGEPTAQVAVNDPIVETEKISDQDDTDTLLPVSADAFAPAAAPVEKVVEPTAVTLPLVPLPTAVEPALLPLIQSEEIDPTEIIPGQVVLHFQPGTSNADRDAYIESLGGELVDRIPALNSAVVRLPEVKSALVASPILATAEHDYAISAQVETINDALYSQQWGLDAIGAPQSWEALPANPVGVTVAVIDSGICATHPDLTGRLLPGYDFIDGDADAADAFGHGCAVAGVIAANVSNNIGIAGVAPNVNIMPLRVLDATGTGAYSDVAAALVWAADNGADIANISLGGASPSNVLAEAVNYAVGKGTMVIAAAGNTGNSSVLYPAAYDNVIAVGSVGQNLQPSAFSSSGSTIDLWGPGEAILSTNTNGDYTFSDGTSFAAPHVAGAAALEMGLGSRLTVDGGVVFVGGRGTVVTPLPPPATPEPTEYEDLLAKARQNGTVRVIVGLNVAFNPQTTDAQALAAQTVNVQNVRAQLHSTLAGTNVILHENAVNWVVPYTAMQVDEAGLRLLIASPLVTVIQEDIPSPPDLASSIPVINADDVWSAGYEGAGWTVAILDTGVEAGHPFMGGGVVNEACFSTNSGANIQSLCPNGTNTQNGAGAASPNVTRCFDGTTNICDHGTHVAGIAAGVNGDFDSDGDIDGHGVARQALIMAVQVFSRFNLASDCNPNPAPCVRTTVANQIDGLNHVFNQRNNFDIAAVNMSLGGGNNTSTCDGDSRKANIDQLLTAGIATVISSGNDSFTNATGAPGCISTAITVSSTRDNDAISGFANTATFIDMFAPGSSIDSSVPGGGYANFDGTSMAAPHVAGAFAVLRSAVPTATVAQIEAALENTGTAVTGRPGVTQRRINLNLALNELGPVPPNDLIGGEIGLSLPDTEVMYTRGATSSAYDTAITCGSNVGRTIWYRFTATEIGRYAVNTSGSNFDTVAGVFTGSAAGLTQVACDDDDGTDLDALVVFSTTPGVTYHIMIGGYNNANGEMRLAFTQLPPPHDLIGNARIIPGLPYTDTDNTRVATTSLGDVTPLCGFEVGKTVWYRFTPTQPRLVRFDTNGSAFDTVLQVWSGSPGSLVPVDCDDDSGTGVTSQLEVALDAGVQYYIQLGGYRDAGGVFTLNAIQINRPPTVTPMDDQTVDEGSLITVPLSGTDPDNDALSFSAIPGTATFDIFSGLWSWEYTPDDGASDSGIVTITGADGFGGLAIETFALTVVNVAPTADLINQDGVVEPGTDVTLAFVNPLDPSGADTAAGFLYSYDCTNDGTFEATDIAASTYDCPTGASGVFTVRGRITDKDGGFTEYTIEIIVNAQPVLTYDQSPVTRNEGQTVKKSGTVSDLEGDPITLSASIGTIVDKGGGKWEWSYKTTDGPAETQTVVITASDGISLPKNEPFDLTVNNVAPVAKFNNLNPVIEATESAMMSFSQQFDPSPVDTAAGFLYSYDCDGDGVFEAADSLSPQYPCNYPLAGRYTIIGRIADKDGGFTDYTARVRVKLKLVGPATYASCSAVPTSDTIQVIGLGDLRLKGQVIVEYQTGRYSRALVPGGLYPVDHSGPADFVLTINYPPVTDWPSFIDSSTGNRIWEIHVDLQLQVMDASGKWVLEDNGTVYVVGPDRDWDVFCRTLPPTPTPFTPIPTETPVVTPTDSGTPIVPPTIPVAETPEETPEATVEPTLEPTITPTPTPTATPTEPAPEVTEAAP